MPPKDDDEAPTTKDVVSKKHKQMLNREELDLSLIAEAFGGVLVEEPRVVQPSLPGTGKRSVKKKEIKTDEDPLAKLKRLLKTSRADKYKTNEPVSGKQAQQFDIDIAGKAADDKSGAGGKPGAGQTKSLRGQTLTKGPYKGATPISKAEADILRKYAKSPGVGQNPLRSQPGSGAELTTGRKRSLKASARRAVEKQSQARRSAVGKQIRQAGSEVLTQIQKQARKGKEVQSRMTRSVEKWAKKEGPKVLKKVQGEVKSKGQLSLPGLGRSFGKGASARGAAAQDAAIDIAKDQRKAAGFRDLAKAVKGVRPVSGAARDPWKQFPKKPQPQRGLPRTGPSSPLPRTQALPPAKSQSFAGALPEPKPKPASTLVAPTKPTSITKTGDTKIKPVTVKDITQTVQDKNKPRITKTSTKPTQLPPAKPPISRTAGTVANLFGLGRAVVKKDPVGVVMHGLQVGQEIGRLSREMEVKRKEREALKPIKPGTTISVMGKDGKVKQLTPDEFEKLKPTKKPGVKPAPAPAPAKPAEPETQPSPQKDDTGTKKKAPPVAPPGGDKKGTPSGTGTPDKTKAPVQVPDIFKFPVPVVPRTGTTVKPPGGNNTRRRRRLPGFGFPEQPGGKIGRRSNPQ